ncbi:MAG: peptidoglycan-associated lipoprotein Pal [Nitrospiraceae bacterium]
MKWLQSAISLSLVLGMILLGMAGCSKKAIQSGGDQQSSQPGGAKGSSESAVITESSPSFPDTSLSGRDGSGGLRGLDKNPSEERVGGGTNTLMAKADPGSAGRQMDEIRAEQSASAAAGLRDVFFAYDSFLISDEGRQALARNAEWMKANPAAQLKVEGHCDERGTSAYNLVLGEKRAKSARNYLVELGVAANRLAVVSYGKERPFCREHAESCYAQNRRGHVVLRTGK